MQITPQTLIARMEWMAKNQLTEFCFEQDDNRVSIVRGHVQSTDASNADALSAVPAPVQTVNSATEKNTGFEPIPAPLSGVCYFAQDAESAPFVAVGDKVSNGQTVCLIEAMKVMTAVTIECDGIVEEICFEDSSLVEAGDILIKVRT